MGILRPSNGDGIENDRLLVGVLPGNGESAIDRHGDVWIQVEAGLWSADLELARDGRSSGVIANAADLVSRGLTVLPGDDELTVLITGDCGGPLLARS